MEIDLDMRISKANFKRKKIIMIAKIFERRDTHIYRNKNEECKIFLLDDSYDSDYEVGGNNF